MKENYHVIHRKIVIERKQLCKEWAYAIARTARGDDNNNNNNNTHLFSLLSVNKFKRFLLNFLIKHMVNASLSIAELWMRGGTQLLQDLLWLVDGFLIIILLSWKKYKVYKEYGEYVNNKVWWSFEFT